MLEKYEYKTRIHLNNIFNICNHLINKLYDRELCLDVLDINCQDYAGDTLLHEATKKNSIKMISFLIANKANINIKNNDGMTPLHYAALYNSYEAAKLLLSNGAEKDALTDSGVSALFLADRYDKTGKLSKLFVKTEKELKP